MSPAVQKYNEWVSSKVYFGMKWALFIFLLNAHRLHGHAHVWGLRSIWKHVDALASRDTTSAIVRPTPPTDVRMVPGTDVAAVPQSGACLERSRNVQLRVLRGR